MSFSSDAKAELCLQKIDKKSSAAAECYGVLMYCNTFSPTDIRIITASSDFAQRLPRLFRRAFSLEFDYLPDEGCRGKRSFEITDAEKIDKILSVYGADAETLENPRSQHLELNLSHEKETNLVGALVIAHPKQRILLLQKAKLRQCRVRVNFLGK